MWACEPGQRSEVMLQRESHSVLSSGETLDKDCEVGAVCLCEAGPCTLCPPTDTLLCERCGRSRPTIARFSEGYGTEEECLLSDPQGESDADADIEDTDCRLQEAGSLQRISSRRRKRPRVARQDTTESEDDGGRSHRSHRWNLRLSPDRGRTILEESVSQMRPLILCRPDQTHESRAELPRGAKLPSAWPSSLSLPLVLLLSLPLSLSLVIVIVSFLLPWARA